jgi:hypothetical protein
MMPPAAGSRSAGDNAALFYARHNVLEVVLTQSTTGPNTAVGATGDYFGPATLDTLPEGGTIPDSKVLHIAGRYYHSVQCDGDMTSLAGTVQVSLNGRSWYTVATISAAGIVTFTGLYKYLRLHVTTNTAGTTGLTATYNGAS